MNWMAITHEELYQKLHGGHGPAGHQPVATQSNDIAWVLANTEADLGKALSSLGAVWEGAAAEQAVGKIDTLRQWTNSSGEKTNTRTTSILDGMSAFVHARNSMPEPKRVPSLEELGNSNALRDVFQLTQDREVLEGAANEAHREAARVMQAYADAVNKPVPDYDEPPRFGGGGAPGDPRPGTPVGGGGRAITRPRGGDIGEGQDIGENVGGEGVPTPPIPDQRGGQNLDVPGPKFGEVQQAGFTPPPALTNSGGLGSIAGPGGSAVGGGSGAAVGGLLARPGANLSAPPVNQPPRPTPPPVRPTTATTTAAGARQGFMQPALGTGQREEDQEHERKYDITEDIVGELPMVAPPVIGE